MLDKGKRRGTIVLMKKLLTGILVIVVLLSLRSSTVYAWPNIVIPTIRIPNFNLIIPTITRTPTPSPTVTPSPTEIPPPPPTDTPIQEAEVLGSQDERIPTASPTGIPTPTPQENKSTSQKDIIYGGIVGLLVLVILMQAWPRIKKFLHEKTA